MQGLGRMTDIRRELPKQTWHRIWRFTGLLTAASTAISIVLTNLFMETFSAGLNVPGLMISLLMPITLGTPMMFYLTLRHEQLRHANRQLELLATIDSLTDCFNRRAFTSLVSRNLERRVANGVEGGALLVVDADEFKTVNDRFGHQHGDEALRLIANAIRMSVRINDVVGRMGGEEFGVYLAGADLGRADEVAERIRCTVSQLEFTPDGQACPLSVSIGGAAFIRRQGFNELYRLADQRLYDAKNTGRDRVALMQAA
jgi:diguanylate cyclase (GGDEF)-like protein